MDTFASGAQPPKFTLRKSPPAVGSAEEQRNHNDLRKYVNDRLAEAENDRSLRIGRYASIDRAISTWQKMSAEDAERSLLEETSGRMQGLPMNLPLMATHLDDTVAFFTEIFAPESHSFYSTPEGLESDAVIKKLVTAMNQETSFTGYAKDVARSIRALLKYNLGGFSVRWIPSTDSSVGGNRFTSCDMYNTVWDPVITELDRVSVEAEWAASYRIMTRRQLITSLQDDFISDRVDEVLRKSQPYGPDAATSEWATRFIRPPTHVGLTIDGQPQVQAAPTQINWASYGLGGSNTGWIPVGGLEKTSVFIWLDPSEFGLATRQTKTYELWHLIFVNGINCFAEQVVENELEEDDERIPVFLGHLTDDDMGEAQRSPMELMRGFQRFSSFLMNIWVLGARKSVYGITYYDPDLFDPSSVNEGQVAGYVPIKKSGRDLRATFYKDDGKTGVENTISMLTNVLQITQGMFPSQGIPAQVAGIDRAVKDQVAVLLHSARARLKLQTRTIDASLFMPTRQQAFRNRMRKQGAGYKGLTEEHIAQVLGSGLKSLDSERVEMFLRELITMVGTSEALATRFDLEGMMTAFSRAMNLGFDLGHFVREQPAIAAPTGAEEVAAAAAPAA